METGNYTGDGTLAQVVNTAITPRHVCIFRDFASEDPTKPGWERIDLMQNDINFQHAGGGHSYMDNQLIALGVGSFTVDDDGVDAHPNELGAPYIYVAYGT